MFENLFKRPTALDRHRKGSFFEARELFLRQCAKQGYSQAMLQKIAWVLLSIVQHIDIENGKFTTHDVEAAVNNQICPQSPFRSSRLSQHSRQLFVRIAVKWLRSIDRFLPPYEVEIPFSEQLLSFSRFLHEERGLSVVTISTRYERLVWFFNSLNPSRNSLSQVSIYDIDAFISAKGNQGWKRSSLSSLASSLRSFYNYAEGQGWCASGISARIETPRLYSRESLPISPSWQDVQQLLVMTRGDDPCDIRNHAILMILSVYGLRRREVEQLLLDDLDWIGERISVSRPKQNRIQLYPLIPEVGEAVLRYLTDVRPRSKYRNIFLTLSAPIRPLSASSITAIVRSRLRALGIKLPRQGAHCLRHACANHLLESGFSFKEIGDQLGHRTVRSTLNYTKIYLAGLREVAELDLRRML